MPVVHSDEMFPWSLQIRMTAFHFLNKNGVQKYHNPLFSHVLHFKFPTLHYTQYIATQWRDILSNNISCFCYFVLVAAAVIATAILNFFFQSNQSIRVILNHLKEYSSFFSISNPHVLIKILIRMFSILDGYHFDHNQWHCISLL